MWLLLSGLLPNRGLAQGILGIALLAILAAPFVFAWQCIAYVGGMISGGMFISSSIFVLGLALLFIIMPIALYRRKWVLSLGLAAITAVIVFYIFQMAPLNRELQRYYHPDIVLDMSDSEKRGLEFLQKFGYEGYLLKSFVPDAEQYVGRVEFEKLCMQTLTYSQYRGDDGFVALNVERVKANLPIFTDKQRASCSDFDAIKAELKFDAEAMLNRVFHDMKAGYDVLASAKAVCGGDPSYICTLVTPFTVEVTLDGLPFHGIHQRGTRVVTAPALDPAPNQTDPMLGLNYQIWQRAVEDLHSKSGMTGSLCAMDMGCRWLLKRNIKFKN